MEAMNEVYVIQSDTSLFRHGETYDRLYRNMGILMKREDTERVVKRCENLPPVSHCVAPRQQNPFAQYLVWTRAQGLKATSSNVLRQYYEAFVCPVENR